MIEKVLPDASRSSQMAVPAFRSTAKPLTERSSRPFTSGTL